MYDDFNEYNTNGQNTFTLGTTFCRYNKCCTGPFKTVIITYLNVKKGIGVSKLIGTATFFQNGWKVS